MEKNEFTAALANKEVVFFVVSHCYSFLLRSYLQRNQGKRKMIGQPKPTILLLLFIVFSNLYLSILNLWSRNMIQVFIWIFSDPTLTLIPMPGFCSNYISNIECLDVALVTIQLAGSCQTVVLTYFNKSLAFLDLFSLLPLEMSMEGIKILTCLDWVSFNLISDNCKWIS